MKRIFVLTFAAIACLCGCIGCTEDDALDELALAENEVVSRNSSDEDLQFIDFVDDESFDSQILVIGVAAERLDKYVSFTGERYVMEPCTPQEVGLSQRVFDYMQGRMKKQNERVDTFKDHVLIDGKVFVYSEIKYMPPRIASRSESVPIGGITSFKVEDKWYGADVEIRLSNSTLHSAGMTLSAAAFIVAFIPDPTVAKAVTAACGLAGLTCLELEHDYPNGVIISVIYTPVTGCIPYSLTSQ